jgi:hypothetical protein
MQKVLSVLMAALVLVPLVPPPARAQGMQDELAGRAPACFADAVRNLEKGKPVTLYRAGREPLVGQFDSVSPDFARIALTPVGETDAGSLEYPLGDVIALEYKDRGHLDATSMVGGLLIGAILGATVGVIAGSGQRSQGMLDFGEAGIVMGCTAGGAVVGLMIGAALSASGQVRRIECKE